jgi:hypothetical protein
VFLVVALLLAAFSLTGCGARNGPSGTRIVEREESVDREHVKLRSELTPARGTLGDPILWRLTASVPGRMSAALLRVEPPPASLEIDTTKAAARPGGSGAVSREIHLRGFDLGAIPLPRATLEVMVAGRPDTLEFPRDTLFVDSLTTQAADSLRPDRGALTTPLRPVDYAVLIGGGILFLAILLYLIRLALRARRRKEVPAPVLAPDPPESVLNRELDRLEHELSTLSRDVFYERLAQALRSYATTRTGVAAMDLTTSELDRALAKREQVPAAGRERLIAALRRADLAKFGRLEDQESEARSVLREARAVGGAL